MSVWGKKVIVQIYDGTGSSIHDQKVSKLHKTKLDLLMYQSGYLVPDAPYLCIKKPDQVYVTPKPNMSGY